MAFAISKSNFLVLSWRVKNEFSMRDDKRGLYCIHTGSLPVAGGLALTVAFKHGTVNFTLTVLFQPAIEVSTPARAAVIQTGE